MAAHTVDHEDGELLGRFSVQMCGNKPQLLVNLIAKENRDAEVVGTRPPPPHLRQKDGVAAARHRVAKMLLVALSCWWNVEAARLDFVTRAGKVRDCHCASIVSTFDGEKSLQVPHSHPAHQHISNTHCSPFVPVYFTTSLGSTTCELESSASGSSASRTDQSATSQGRQPNHQKQRTDPYRSP